jgi:hypothetical protein
MARRTPPLRPAGAGLVGLGIDALAEPLVSTASRAATMLGCEPAQLVTAAATAGLEPWGRHANGAAVYRWPELCRAAAAAGIPTPSTRPTLAEYHERREQRRTRKQTGEQARRQARRPS